MSGQKVEKPKENDTNSLMSLLKRFGIGMMFFIGLVSSLAGIIRSITQDPGLYAIVFLVAGIGFILLSLLILYFRKIIVSSSITNEKRRVPAYPERARRLALIGLLTVPILAFAGVWGWFYFRSLPSDKVIVLVAEFDGPEPKKYRVTEKILRCLREATEKYDDISIEALNEVITEQDGREIAREKGKNKKASIVLWGWYAATGVQAEISFDFVPLMEPVDQEFKIKQQPFSAPINELETFTMQTQLSIGARSLVLVTIGLVRYERGDYKAAISLFSDALSDQKILHKSFIARIYFNRANAYSNIGDYDSAISDNTIVCDLYPDFASAYFNRANAYAIKKLYREAIADYDQAIKKRPDHANAHYGRGFAYYCLGNHDEAMRSFNASASVDSNNVGVFVGLGQIYHDKGEFGRAIKEYSRGIRLAPNWAQLYNNRGNAYRANGEYSRAISDFDHAIRHMPSYVKAYLNRGLTYSEIKDFDHAISDFDSTLKLSPASADAYLNRGFVYSQIGQKSLAIADYQNFLKISKDQEIRQTVKLELQRLGVDISDVE